MSASINCCWVSQFASLAGPAYVLEVLPSLRTADVLLHATPLLRLLYAMTHWAGADQQEGLQVLKS
jgi:hypothetical protein